MRKEKMKINKFAKAGSYYLTGSLFNHHFTTFHAPKGIKIQTTPNFLYD